EMIFVSATKGLDTERLMRMSEVIKSVVGARFPPRVVALSGPTFAREVARGDPTAIVAASEDREAARLIQREFSSPALRLYTSTDVAGVELGGSLKNVIAIAPGVGGWPGASRPPTPRSPWRAGTASRCPSPSKYTACSKGKRPRARPSAN